MTAETTSLPEGEHIVRCTSSLDCGGRCPIRAHVKDGVIVRIEGDDFPDEDGQLRACWRGRAYRHYIYHPDRLMYPMKLAGKKGSKDFERISWDEAISTIVTRLTEIREKYGPSSLFYGGGGHLGAVHGPGPIQKALALTGGYTSEYGNISSEGAVWAVMSTYGDVMVGHGRADMLNTKMMIMWGWDPVRMISGTDCVPTLIKVKEKGIPIIAIGPRYEDTAATFATEWIPIIPGTDTAMMAAMANVILKENLQDQAFIDKYTEGFDKYADYVMGREDGVDKTPEWAEAICGVPAARIADLARQYATTDPACLMDCQGPARASYGEQYNRGAIALTAMTGNVGKKGGSAAGGLMGIPYGHMFRSAGTVGAKNPAEAGGPSIRGTLDINLRIVRRIHCNKIWDGFLEGTAGGYPADIKAAYFAGGNRLNQRGNANKGARALSGLEFAVSNELFLTPTARYCDIVLPVRSFAENNDLTRPWPSGPYLAFSSAAIEPMGECKSDFEIGNLLGEAWGLPDFNPMNEEQWLRSIIATHPEYVEHAGDYDKFKEESISRMELDEPYIAFKEQIEDPENNPFKTPSGKIEIYSQRLADLDSEETPAVPKYVVSKTRENRNHALAAKYPLEMLSPHPRVRCHSQLQNVDWLVEVDPHVAWINPVDAEPRGILDGDDIHVFNDRGKIAIKAWVTRRIIPGVISIYEGTWYDPDENGIDIGGCTNTLTDDVFSPGGAATLKTCLVDIAKA